MAQFRKRPVVIEAMQFNPGTEVDVLAFAEGNAGLNCQNSEPDYLLISTLEGHMRADHGDWIIKGVKGEFYSCKPDIFEATYEIVPPVDVMP